MLMDTARDRRFRRLLAVRDRRFQSKRRQRALAANGHRVSHNLFLRQR
jgi:hypothetical protein